MYTIYFVTYSCETGLLAIRELEEAIPEDTDDLESLPLSRADSIAEEDEPPESMDTDAETEAEPESATAPQPQLQDENLDDSVFARPSEDVK